MMIGDGMKGTDPDEHLRAEIHRKAAAHAEATVYSLNNPYLSQREKVMVEAVYQFPLAVFTYAFALVALVQDQGFWMSYVWASIISSLAWAAARFLPGRLFYPASIAFAGSGYMIVTFGLTILALVEGRWGIAAFLGVSAFGLTSLIEAPMWLWTITSRRFNAKYGIAKRLFGITFPFEAELD